MRAGVGRVERGEMDMEGRGRRTQQSGREVGRAGIREGGVGRSKSSLW